MHRMVCEDGGTLKEHVLVLGGDARSRWAARGFEELGYPVQDCPEDLPESIQADLALLPLPLVTGDFVTGTVLPMDAVLAALPASCRLYAGRVPRAYQARITDLSLREDFALRNAVPTAEGALSLLLNALPGTLNGARILVIGFGRIGKALSARLQALGVQVCVTARRSEDLDAIQALGMEADRTGRYQLGLCYDAVVNTVPARVFSEEQIARTPQDCYLLDLASLPGGIDFAACRAMERRCCHALALPGKAAPKTAGLILRDLILEDRT